MFSLQELHVIRAALSKAGYTYDGLETAIALKTKLEKLIADGEAGENLKRAGQGAPLKAV